MAGFNINDPRSPSLGLSMPSRPSLGMSWVPPVSPVDSSLGEYASLASYGPMKTNYGFLNGSGVASSTPHPTELSWFDKMIGTKDQPGWGNLALGLGNFGLNAFMGMKQYGMAKDQLGFQKDAFSKNYEAQKGAFNSEMADRQKARLAFDPSADYLSVAEQLSRYGVK